MAKPYFRSKCIVMKNLAIGALVLLAFAACNRLGNERDCPDRTLFNSNRCPEDTVWVCGCDDSTYVNECRAEKNGAWVQSVGKCPDE